MPWAARSSSAARKRKDRRALLIAGLVFNLGLIATFKYDTLFVSTANDLLGIGLPVPHFFLPLAISFFTFEQISYLVDADAGKTAQLHPAGLRAVRRLFPAPDRRADRAPQRPDPAIPPDARAQ